MLLAAFAQTFGPLAIAPIFPVLIEEFHTDLTGVAQFTGITILVLGFSNFIWYETIGHKYSLRRKLLILAGS